MSEGEASVSDARVEVRAFGQNASVVWVGIRRVPRNVSTIVNAVAERVRALPERHSCALHIEHRDTDDLEPPDLQGFLSLAGALLEQRELLDARVMGTCLQAKRVDETVHLAHGLFLTMYRPKRAFEVLCGEEAARNFLTRTLSQ